LNLERKPFLSAGVRKTAEFTLCAKFRIATLFKFVLGFVFAVIIRLLERLSAVFSMAARLTTAPATVRPSEFKSMPLATLLTPAVAKSAGVAYVHYLSFMLCFAALVVERRLLRPDPDRRAATAMVITDIIYGLAALALLVSGILRVLYFGQGSAFYTSNPLFWWKVGLYLSVGALSLYPTITYILWAIPLRKGELPKVSEALATRLGWIINVELVGFALVPLLATLMARGVGLPAA
jgi:putative membrane protein